MTHPKKAKSNITTSVKDTATIEDINEPTTYPKSKGAEYLFGHDPASTKKQLEIVEKEEGAIRKSLLKDIDNRIQELSAAKTDKLKENVKTEVIAVLKVLRNAIEFDHKDSVERIISKIRLIHPILDKGVFGIKNKEMFSKYRMDDREVKKSEDITPKKNI